MQGNHRQLSIFWIIWFFIVLSYAVDVKIKMMGNELKQHKIKNDEIQTKKINLILFKSVFFPLKIETR